MAVTKSTLHRSHYVLSFPSIELYKVFFPFIGRDRRSAVIHRKFHGSSQRNSKMNSNSNELQGRIQIHYQTLFKQFEVILPSRYKIHSQVQKWLNRGISTAKETKPKIYFYIIVITLGHLPSLLFFVFSYHQDKHFMPGFISKV